MFFARYDTTVIGLKNINGKNTIRAVNGARRAHTSASVIRLAA